MSPPSSGVAAPPRLLPWPWDAKDTRVCFLARNFKSLGQLFFFFS